MTLSEIPLRLDEPIWLVLLVFIVPALLIAWRAAGSLSRTKTWMTFGLRALLIAMLAVALARPHWEKRGRGLTVTVLLDRSLSLPLADRRRALDYVSAAVEAKERPEDRTAVITIGKEASIAAMADSYTAVEVDADIGDLAATNLAAGVDLALAIAPNDTANRILLVSDGNETEGTVLRAAELARANGVPVDVLIVEYEYAREVIFEQIVAPARARQGQTAELKLVLHSQAEARGTIRLEVNGQYMDLNGGDPGDGLAVTLDPGVNAFAQTISLDVSGPHEFEAVFIPDDPTQDAIDRNNRAMAVTFVGGEGKVLVIDDGFAQSEHLIRALTESGITVDAIQPAAMGGAVQLSGYDAVILANIPRWAFDEEQDRILHAYVHDLGGGLVMLGGRESFGAGGWIDSQVARTLPVLLNPPQTRQMPAGALALIMHSCEMPQGNYWGQRVAQSAIEALSRLDYAGIVEFSFAGMGGIQGCDWAYPMQRLGDKVAALDATKKMKMGDMPSFAPSMQLALQGLTGVPAAQRHAIIISDGDPSPPSAGLLQKYVDNRVTVTTVMVGGHGTAADQRQMQNVATKTGGNFYAVQNPKQLPQIFIKEAQIVSRSLIQDGDVYTPSIMTSLPGPVRGFGGVPEVDGYVLTAQREGLAQTPIAIRTTEGNDPLFAHWNYGLGRSIAYTSDLSNLWGARWASWSRFRAFWEQSIRWVMKPATPMNMHVSTRVEGDVAIVEVEALESDASFLNFLRASALVVRPDAERETLPLQQTRPGRYRTTFKVDEPGAYLVNVAYQTSAADDASYNFLPAAVTVPYAREYRSVKHNAALLRDLAQRTGGRELEWVDPQLADLYAREGLPIPKSAKRIWDLLAILAASLLIVDVAARRLSFDAAKVGGAVSRALGQRGEVSSETVAAWKRTRTQVAHRRDDPDAESTRARRGARFDADDADPRHAIDVGGEGRDDGGTPRPTASRTQPKPDAAPDDIDSHTSRLLAAKRRAMGDENSNDGGGPADA